MELIKIFLVINTAFIVINLSSVPWIIFKHNLLYYCLIHQATFIIRLPLIYVKDLLDKSLAREKRRKTLDLIQKKRKAERRKAGIKTSSDNVIPFGRK